MPLYLAFLFLIVPPIVAYLLCVWIDAMVTEPPKTHDDWCCRD